MKKIVVGIPYEDTSTLVAGTDPPVFYPIQIFEVKDENSLSALERHVTPPQHVWTYAGNLSPRAEAYYVERLGADVPSELPESEITSEEMSEIIKLKNNLQFTLRMDAQKEFDPSQY